MSQKLLMSIDFGSYGVFVAFCVPGNPGSSRKVEEWPGVPGNMYEKNSTAILLRKDDHSVVSFGWDAQNKYTKSKEEKTDDQYIFFMNFKTKFLQREGFFDINLPIYAVDGINKMPIGQLITLCLKDIKDHSLSFYHKKTSDSIDANEVLWVVTIPAIWDEMSKEAMKRCCKNAGMEHFDLALEPEAAGFYILHGSEEKDHLVEGDKYLLLDVGGGTYDSVCHEIGDNKAIKEVCHADGGLKGSIDIDTAYVKLLSDLFSKEVITNIQNNFPEDYVELITNFVVSKEKADPGESHRNVIIPPILNDLYNDDPKITCQNFSLGGENNLLEWKRGKMRMKTKIWWHLHDEILNEICDFVCRILNEWDTTDVTKVFLVGGFSLSKYLQNRLQDRLIEHCDRPIQVLRPPRSELAVALGGLWFSTKKNEGISARRSRFTYGMEVDAIWKKGDEISHRVIDNRFYTGFRRIKVFEPFIYINEEWIDNHAENRQYPILPNATEIKVDIYKTKDEYPRYTDDDGCELEKKFVYKLGDLTKKSHENFFVRIVFQYDGLSLFLTTNTTRNPCLLQMECNFG